MTPAPCLTFGSVCSGIEAASMAWGPLGWEAAFVSEIEAFPRAVLKHRHPEVPLHGDFTTIEAGQYRPIDLLVGGTPCQSFSVAGLRGGLSDARGNLALEFLRLADRLRPRWVVWENVPGVFSATSHDAPDPRPPARDLGGVDGPADGEEVVVEDEYDADEDHALACFLAGLSELGYFWAYRVLDAQYSGVPQRRRRIFVVGYLGDWRPPAAVLFERASLSGDPPPRRGAGQGAAGPVAGRAVDSGQRAGRAAERRSAAEAPDRGDVARRVAFGGGQNCNETDVSTAVTAHPGGRYDFELETFVAEISPTLNAGGNGINPLDQAMVAQTLTGGARRAGGFSYDDVPTVAHALRAEGFDASEDGTGRGTPLVPHSFDARQSDGCQYGDLTGPLDADGHTMAVAFGSKDSGLDAEVELAPTLRAGGHAGSHANAGVPPAVAFALRGREGGALPEIEGDGDRSGALRAAGGGSSRDYVAFDLQQITSPTNRSTVQSGAPAPTLAKENAVHCVDVGIGHNGPPGKALDLGMAVRRLTPRECERLQGFPDDYTLIPWRGGMAPDGPRYKALGNSMAVPVMRWIGERIAAVEAELQARDAAA